MAFSSRGAVGGTTGRPVLVAFILDFWTGLVEDGDFSAPWDFDEATGDFSSELDFVSVGLAEDCSPEALFFFPFFLDLDSWWLWGSVGVALGWWLGGGAVGVVCPDFGAGSCLWVVCFTPDWCEGVGASFSISFLLSDCFSKITWIFLSKVCLKKFSMENYQWQKMLLFNFNYPKSTEDKRNLILKRSSNSFHDCRNIYMRFKVKKLMKI